MTRTQLPLYSTRLDIAESIRIPVVALLNQTLASTLDLNTLDKRLWFLEAHLQSTEPTKSDAAKAKVLASA